MPEIKFSNDKADRWIARIEKRRAKLTPEDLTMFDSIKQVRADGGKLPPTMERSLFDIERRV